MTITEMKTQYEKALDEFIPLRNKEEDGDDVLTSEETDRYLVLLENTLLPYRDLLYNHGEEAYLEENAFSYIL